MMRGTTRGRPAVSDERKREILTDVIDALDRAIPQLGDMDAWKWACMGIRRNMAEAVGIPQVTLIEEAHRAHA